MSEDNKTQPTPPPTPVAKTSAVPLKKETVRITLRARPGAGLTQPKELTTPVPSTGTTPVPRPITVSVTPAGAATARVPTAPVVMASKATAPIQLPSAPLPPPAARMATTQVQLPPTPVAPPRPTVAPSAPMAPPRPPGAPPSPGGAAPRPPGAPGISLPATVPLAKIPGPPRAPGAPPTPRAPGAPGAPSPGMPRMEPGATTVPLAKAPPGVPGARPGGIAGSAIKGPTQQLPKATVQLAKGGTAQLQQPQQTIAMTPPSAPIKRAVAEQASQQDFEEEKDPEAGLMPLAVLCFVLALGLMLVNMFGTDKVVGRYPDDTSFFAPLMVPRDNSPTWEERQLDGSHVSKFSKVLEDVKKKFE